MRSRQMIGVDPLVGHGDFPGDVLFRGPSNGQVLFVAHTVETWPAPLRPVLRMNHSKREQHKSQDAEELSSASILQELA